MTVSSSGGVSASARRMCAASTTAAIAEANTDETDRTEGTAVPNGSALRREGDEAVSVAAIRWQGHPDVCETLGAEYAEFMVW